MGGGGVGGTGRRGLEAKGNGEERGVSPTHCLRVGERSQSVIVLLAWRERRRSKDSR